VDTDHFKNINDLFGHLKGDEVLIALSRTLEACSRENDMVFRWGAKSSSSCCRAPLSTPRCRLPSRSVQPLPALRFRAYHGLPSALAWRDITRGRRIDELFKRVDDALYRAKNDGRNKVLAA
jgi:GGDEF domain-containing protein